ncbi:hypothetical protein CR513_08789, partial [Mucuna pruriens]
MVPYEVLYNRNYITPLCWTKVGERPLLRLDLVQETTEKIKMIRDKYENKRRSLEFKKREKVLFRVIPTTNIGRAIKTK